MRAATVLVAVWVGATLSIFAAVYAADLLARATWWRLLERAVP